MKEDLGLGAITPLPDRSIGMEAKFHIAEVLGIEINGAERFKKLAKIGLGSE